MTIGNFNTTFTLYHKQLICFGINLTHNKQQVEDIVSKVFCNLWKSEVVVEHVKQYLYIAVRNGCLDYLKHVKRKTEAENKLLNLAGDEDYTDSKMIEADLLNQIYSQVERLPAQCQKIFRLYYFSKLNTKEISEELGISEDNVRVQRKIAIKILRGML